MYEIEGPAARPPAQRSGCPDRASGRPCCRTSAGPPTRSRSPARCTVVPHPRTRSRGPPIASASAVLVRRTSVPTRGLPLTRTGGVAPRGVVPGNLLRRAGSLVRRSFSAWPGSRIGPQPVVRGLPLPARRRSRLRVARPSCSAWAYFYAVFRKRHKGFRRRFSTISWTHRMCTDCPPDRAFHPQVVPRSVHRWTVI